MDRSPLIDDTRNALHRRIALEQTIAAVSRQLVVADGDALDRALDSALGQLGQFVGADRAYLFQFHPDNQHIYNSHEWCAEGIEPQRPSLQRLHFDPGSSFAQAMRAGRILDIPSVERMNPAVAVERDVLISQGIRSLIAAPIQARGGLMGFIGFDAVRGERAWTPEDHSLLELAVEGIRNSLVRRRTELALRASEFRLKDLFNKAAKISVQGYDEQRRVVFWNQASEELYGYSAAEAQGRLLEDLIIPPPMRDFVVEAHRAWLQEDIEIPAGELVLQRKDGSPVPVFSSHMLRRDADGTVEMYCVDIDLTEQKAAQAGLRLAASVFEHAREGIAVITDEGRIEEVNPAVCRLVGRSRSTLIGQHIDELLHNGDTVSLWERQWEALVSAGHWSGECHQRRADGGSLPVLATLSALREPHEERPHRVVALFADISLQKAHEAELHFLATHDALTGLPNRTLLRDRLTQALLRSRRASGVLGVAYIDLDGFKAVNDAHGHAVGDELLKRVTDKMQADMRGADTLARLGGDEFVAVFVDLPQESAVLPLLTRLQQALSAPIEWDGWALRTSASIGVAFAASDEEADADTLLRQADLAMYQAKLAGKNRYAFFDAGLDRVVRQQHEHEHRFLQALRNDELLLYYQPQVSLRTGEVLGVEALLRWQHPDRGLLAPGDFLAAIQRQDVWVELGEWVTRTALAQATAWMANGVRLKVNVNVAGAHLQHPQFLARLESLLQAYPTVPRDHVVLELLESSALGSLQDVAQVIADCRALGVGVALDDFGTGYSSLTYLKELPANVLKIDRSFVRDMLHDKGDEAILIGILLLGKAFERTVVAEGVETVEQGLALRRLGCEYAQGYGIARPMPAAQVPEWVSRWSPPANWSAP